ncbi:UvrD-helicase domain-containing protein [Acuticoccus sp. MNP-M23]|uniref:ATP-dependent helicase n=1 Tax=Acuticoccus sp. MNP-M23 TaxID=3072793 RepID=UPI0028166008|nr:UvrD-helicase domain-containing protein [Acuticoccus sp. MNP-M23]WMS44236.1 UvrD-helicase domain-containing protein [Acuticoccus sp. MNP-M23]
MTNPMRQTAPTVSIAERAARASRPAPAYLESLNPEQRRAVEAIDGPVLVLAGAGTGKTRVLTTRIAHILALGKARPSEILAVTFTNKASREMKERIGRVVPGQSEGMPWLGTFHAIGTRILRRHAELVDLKPDFTILDTDDQIRLAKQILSAENIDEKRWPARQLLGQIDAWKNRGLTPEEVPKSEGDWFAHGKGLKLYNLYRDRLKTLNAADFGDLLLEPIRLFRKNPDVLEIYQSRFRYMLVDEYQDTNIAQYLWLRLLAQGNRNLCVVGDDDQSIYGWRGAEVDNILRFETDFPGAVVVRLERNYRSTSHILAAASHLISHNEGRLGKTLFTDIVDPDEVPVSVASSWDSEEEARSINDEIERLHKAGGSLDEIAILMRTTAQMRAFEDRFVTAGTPYRVIGGPRFYERKEIRDALAYFRCVTQPAYDLAFERIVNVPARGMGQVTIRTITEAARDREVPLLTAAADLLATDEIKGKARTGLGTLVAQFDRWRTQMATLPHTELAEIILEESGYTDMLKADRSADAPGRLENLKELIRSMDEFDSLPAFLEHVSLVTEAQSDAGDEAVTLMTLHGAKGLEFDVVFLPGWEEGLFPSVRALDESGQSGLEEERRLAYVGLTRARKRAFVWFALNRRIHGMWQSSAPSRFIDELPEDHVAVREEAGYGGIGGYGGSRFDQVETFSSSYHTPGWERAKRREDVPRRQRNLPSTIEGELVAKSVADRPSAYAPGARVFHQKFGNGNVAAVEGNKLTVDFDKAGRKRVLDSFVTSV